MVLIEMCHITAWTKQDEMEVEDWRRGDDKAQQLQNVSIFPSIKLDTPSKEEEIELESEARCYISHFNWHFNVQINDTTISMKTTQQLLLLCLSLSCLLLIDHVQQSSPEEDQLWS